MTEAEWLTGVDPKPLVHFLRALADDRRLVHPLSGGVLRRKIQLYLCGCCRDLWPQLTDPRSRAAVEAAERKADGLIATAAAKLAGKAAERAADEVGLDGWPACRLAAEAVKPMSEGTWNAMWIATSNSSLGLLRCVFGNPFRRAHAGPEFSAESIALAHAAYDERLLPDGALDPARLAVLSDALEEAGCDDDGLLSHLRSPGPHVRGCWALDVVLGKS